MLRSIFDRRTFERNLKGSLYIRLDRETRLHRQFSKKKPDPPRQQNLNKWGGGGALVQGGGSGGFCCHTRVGRSSLIQSNPFWFLSNVLRSNIDRRPFWRSFIGRRCYFECFKPSKWHLRPIKVSQKVLRSIFEHRMFERNLKGLLWIRLHRATRVWQKKPQIRSGNRI